jgi:nucleotide-binding universal stress UspA family protein
MPRDRSNNQKELTLPVSNRDEAAPYFQSRTLAFAIDASEEARSAISWAPANLIQGNDLVLLIHVHQKTFGDCNTNMMRSKVLAQFEECCKRNKWNCQTIIVDGDPVTQIAELVQKHQCDLCILGMKSRQGRLMARRRCIASEIARLCTCAVMIVKKPKVPTLPTIRTTFESLTGHSALAAGRGRRIPAHLSPPCLHPRRPVPHRRRRPRLGRYLPPPARR